MGPLFLSAGLSSHLETLEKKQLLALEFSYFCCRTDVPVSWLVVGLSLVLTHSPFILKARNDTLRLSHPWNV